MKHSKHTIGWHLQLIAGSGGPWGLSNILKGWDNSIERLKKSHQHSMQPLFLGSHPLFSLPLHPPCANPVMKKDGSDLQRDYHSWVLSVIKVHKMVSRSFVSQLQHPYVSQLGWVTDRTTPKKAAELAKKAPSYPDQYKFSLQRMTN